MNVKQLLIAAGLLLVGAGGGFAIARLSPHTPDASIVRQGGYHFINPLLSCDIAEDLVYPGFTSLRDTLNNTVNQAKRAGDVTRVSIYFRDLDRGFWTGVNEDALYGPASLEKVPLAMAVLRDIPIPGLSTTTLMIPNNEDSNEQETFKPHAPLSIGHVYSLATLIDTMLKDSDNNAATTLYAVVATTTLIDTYANLDIPGGGPQDEDTSPKIFARVFRILYNASYIGRAKSEQILEILSQSTFADGIVSGLPAGTVTAHKFGERTFYTPMGAVIKRELHDCGIVYYPPHPYLLCVMTEGQDFIKLEAVIKSISADAFAAVGSGILMSAE